MFDMIGEVLKGLIDALCKVLSVVAVPIAVVVLAIVFALFAGCVGFLGWLASGLPT